MGEDVGRDYGLCCSALSAVLAAVSVPIPRGHDWSTGRSSPVNTSSMANLTGAGHAGRALKQLLIKYTEKKQVVGTCEGCVGFFMNEQDNFQRSSCCSTRLHRLVLTLIL